MKTTIHPNRPSEAAALIGKQVRISCKGQGDSVRLRPHSRLTYQTPFTASYQGECVGYSFHSANAFYLQIAGFGQVDISEPGATLELVRPNWLHRLAIYLGF